MRPPHFFFLPCLPSSCTTVAAGGAQLDDFERLEVPVAQLLVDALVDGLLLGERPDQLVAREGLAREAVDAPRRERALEREAIEPLA